MNFKDCYKLSNGVEIPCLPLPKSVPPSRIKENTEVFDFGLAPEDVQLIADMKGVVGCSADPDTTNF